MKKPISLPWRGPSGSCYLVTEFPIERKSIASSTHKKLGDRVRVDGRDFIVMTCKPAARGFRLKVIEALS